MLEIRNLKVVFETDRGVVKAVNGIDLTLERGKILGLVGESGSGKSMTLLSILRLVPYPGKIVEGEILFEGEDLLKKSASQMREIRGKDIAMIFQDPMTTLNPVFPVGEQIRESLRVHNIIKPEKEGILGFLRERDRRKKEHEKAVELMEKVGISYPEKRYFSYPHQFSGGMQQRAIIAIALSCNPKLLLADEPTTALDVTIQAQILDLLRQINEVNGTSIIFVTHDLAVAAEFCDEIAVMYAGQIVEKGAVDKVIGEPKHPYTKGLLKSIPKITRKKEKLYAIPGNVPDLASLSPKGCPFYERCEEAVEECKEVELPLIEVSDGEFVRCIKYL
ncbi:ABC transporter ATP-binding protein [Caldanaerobacter subterraneus]|uniref:ABC-type dipeptide/oligopeptide/nickel transport system, ATPase component n=1 Tax=Caldanaerobacter subterraneus subsp. pacificus DSM 12653 TaxID=391606 RepID=B7R8J0_9THEO|nr:ABC transporter ATP-binding protein [Caldanaerobacter subterraneus]KKC29158.1 ABC-type dipeptide/oligopeptide/nickel transport system, ATPase component [Caldanaerobacter subterraneus subsp. pacificus DSM 12653]